MAEANATKSAKSVVDKKGKAVLKEAPKKKRTDSTQAPREKLLGSSMAAERAARARLSRDSNTETGKRKRDSQVTPPPPPRNPITEETSEEDIPSDKEQAKILQEAYER
ncbi:hypothetical protein R1sor_026467 [Riccia sorocarpa]|uniref:Uncharacterized protein n=1 Tax=Riccia sorocarpa TaxID=122646 RepID=A0ABD3GH51_9MARC